MAEFPGLALVDGQAWSVLLIEQSRGVELTPLREGEDLSVYVAEDVDVLGHNAGLRYFFTDLTGPYR